jgi:hypothetical protein
MSRNTKAKYIPATKSQAKLRSAVLELFFQNGFSAEIPETLPTDGTIEFDGLFCKEVSYRITLEVSQHKANEQPYWWSGADKNRTRIAFTNT